VAWVLLFVVGALETVWALALKQSDGLTRLVPSVVFAVAGLVSIGLLALALRELPVGTGYAVWTGTGAVGAAIAGIVLLGESAAAGRVVAVGLVAVGIVWLALGE
jgi:quaternary ammonium compound-resistance protein SugE